MIPDLLERSGQILQHMHDHGFVHRDFKPENLMVDGDCSVSLVDMALTWQRRMLGGKPQLAGTPAYMAPELLSGKSPSFATDTFAYAATAYELLAGRPPYEGHSREETLRAVSRGGAKPPSSRNATVPAELDRLVMQGLARKPGDRPKNLVLYGKRLAARFRAGTPSPAPR
jgi:serine/threonine protein kinase